MSLNEIRILEEILSVQPSVFMWPVPT